MKAVVEIEDKHLPALLLFGTKAHMSLLISLEKLQEEVKRRLLLNNGEVESIASRYSIGTGRESSTGAVDAMEELRGIISKKKIPSCSNKLDPDDCPMCTDGDEVTMCCLSCMDLVGCTYCCKLLNTVKI